MASKIMLPPPTTPIDSRYPIAGIPDKFYQDNTIEQVWIWTGDNFTGRPIYDIRQGDRYIRLKNWVGQLYICAEDPSYDAEKDSLVISAIKYSKNIYQEV